MTVKDKACIALKNLGGRATETQLVKEYIKIYPDYDKNYTSTKTSSEAKIRGTINAELMRNSLHENIKVDKTKDPYEYYIVNSQEKLVVIQPIGTNNSIEDFLKENSTRWAEKKRYEKQWIQSNNATVLFVKNGNIFAIGDITNIEKTNHPEYPLDYSYNLELVNYINYEKVLEIIKPKLGNFRTYHLLDSATSKKVLDYINSQKVYYLDDNLADEELQNNIVNINSNEPDSKPQPIRPSKINNDNKVYPRNLSYAKKALEKANFLCEVDRTHKTFVSKSTNTQYAEAHHLIPLQFQEKFIYSLDVPANIISLCPNCHRKLHFASINDKKEILEKLLENRNDELKQFGIDIREKELFKIYT